MKDIKQEPEKPKDLSIFFKGESKTSILHVPASQVDQLADLLDKILQQAGISSYVEVQYTKEITNE